MIRWILVLVLVSNPFTVGYAVEHSVLPVEDTQVAFAKPACVPQLMQRQTHAAGKAIKKTSSIDHKFYVSVTNITYSKKDQALRMVSRFFIDDMQLMMQQRYQTKTELTTEEDREPVVNLLQRYLSSKTELKVNGKPKQLEVIGYEYDIDQMIVYTEVPQVSNVNKISLQFEVLFDVFAEQKNMVHVDYAGRKRTMLLIKERPRETFNY